MQSKLVSVILSVYNGEQFLNDCIQSVINQSYKNIQFIIINDGSKDNSLSIIKNLQTEENNIILVDKPNSGLTKSLNKGLEKAKGDYITRIDADDVWAPNKLEVQVSFMEGNPDILLSGTSINFIDEQGSLLNSHQNSRSMKDEEIRKTYLFENPFCHSSIIFRKNLIKQIGPYNIDFEYAQDYEYWYRIMLKGRVEIIPNILVSRRVTDNMIGIKRSRNQKYFALKTKIKVFVNSKPSVKGLKHLTKTLIGAIIPSAVSKIIRANY